MSVQGTVAYHTQMHHAFRINKYTWALLSLICLFFVCLLLLLLLLLF